MIDDGLFDGLDAALLFHPSSTGPRRVPAARLRGRRRHVHGPPGARGRRPVGGAQRPRRDGDAAQRRSPCGASSSGRTRGSTGSSSRAGRPRTSSRTGRSGRFMIRSADEARLRRDAARASRRSSRPPRGATGCDGRGRLLRRLVDDAPQRDDRRAVRRATGGARAPGRTAGPGARQLRHGQRQPGPATIHPHLAICDDGHRRATRSSSARPRARPGPTR